jgi:sterol desaturase/sphingolipid hydroxylase (fatty acid hydroxylase superfamily)
MGIHQFLLFFMPIFIVMIVTEFYVGRKNGLSLYTRGDTTASILIAIGQQLTSLLGLGIVVGATMAFTWEYRLFDLPASSWWYIPALFVGHEFAYYWFHRVGHTVRWVWASHSVHHSTEEMNVLAAYRFGWTGWLSMGRLVFVPLVWVGFEPRHVMLMLVANLMYQSWLHTTLIGKLGPLEGIMNTPSAHRVHHARNADYLDRNHGGVFIVFDRMFGTYVAERDDEPVEFGLIKPSLSHNPVRIAFHEWGNIVADLRSNPVRHWPGFLFGLPGWAPNGKGTTSADLRASYNAVRPVQDVQGGHAIQAVQEGT